MKPLCPERSLDPPDVPECPDDCRYMESGCCRLEDEGVCLRKEEEDALADDLAERQHEETRGKW